MRGVGTWSHVSYTLILRKRNVHNKFKIEINV